MSKPVLIGVSDLIERLKEDLLQAEAETTPMFSIDEVSIALDVAVTAEIGGGFSLKILPSFISDTGLSMEAKTSGVETQSLTLKLSPLLSKEERIALFKKQNPKRWAEVEDGLAKATIRGI